MTQVLPCLVTEKARSQIGITLGVINWVCSVGSLCIISLGAYIRISIGQYTKLIEGYDGNGVAFSLIVIGLLSAIVNAGGGFCCFVSANRNKRKTYRLHLFIYFICSLIMCLLLVVIGSECYGATPLLTKSFSGGITTAMKQYAHTPVLKQEIDELQLSFSCCGNEAYTDWFGTPWILEDFSNNAHGNVADQDGYYHDDVPFSCCDKNAKRPCIHSDIHTNNAHKNYDYKTQLSINPIGCVDALMDYFGDVLLVNCGAFVLVVFCLQLAITILVRYYQTSIFEALKLDQPDADTKGYLFAYNQAKDKGEIPRRISEPKFNQSQASLASKKNSNMDNYQNSEEDLYATCGDTAPSNANVGMGKFGANLGQFGASFGKSLAKIGQSLANVNPSRGIVGQSETNVDTSVKSVNMDSFEYSENEFDSIEASEPLLPASTSRATDVGSIVHPGSSSSQIQQNISRTSTRASEEPIYGNNDY